MKKEMRRKKKKGTWHLQKEKTIKKSKNIKEIGKKNCISYKYEKECGKMLKDTSTQ